MASKLWSPRSPGHEEKIKWSKEGLAELRLEVRSLASWAAAQPGAEPPRILFLGETASGKSSLISSMISALKGRIIYTSTVGQKGGHEVNTSKRFLEHRVFLKEDGNQPLNFTLCDSRGIAKKRQLGAARAEIKRLIDGYVHHGDLIEDESTEGADSGFTSYPEHNDPRPPKPPSFVVFVQRATGLGDKDPDVHDKLDIACELVRKAGIPSCVVLTHIDHVKKDLENNLHLALSSNKIQERVSIACSELGFNRNRVFVVKNYVDEGRTHTRHDILLLRALRGILLDVQQADQDRQGRWPADQRGRDHRGFGPDDLPLDPKQMVSEPPSDSGYKSMSMYPSSSSSSSRMSPSYSSLQPSSDVTDQLTSISQQQQRQQQQQQQQPGQSRDGQRTRGQTSGPKTRPSLRRNRQQQTKVDPQPPLQEFEAERNTPTRTSKSSFGTERSGTHDYTISTEDDVQLDEANNSDEKDFHFTQDDEDEGIERSLSNASFTTDLMKDLVDQLPHMPYPQYYQDDAGLRGAKPLQRRRVLQQNHSKVTSTDDEPFPVQQLQKDYFSEDYYSQLQLELQQWSRAHVGAIWTSDTLHNDLGLPITRYPPSSVDVQVLLLCPGRSAMLLTVFDPERVLQDHDVSSTDQSQSLINKETEDVEIYTRQVSKLLTSSLFCYCSCDFLLLPCTISYKHLTPNNLDKEVERQMCVARRYYRGPRVLTETTYRRLKAAATAVMGVSYVPRLLAGADDGSNKETLVLLDRPWQGVVSLLVEKLTRVDNGGRVLHVQYPEGGWFKMAVAVMEAGRRLSFGEEVVIITDRRELIECCGPLKKQIKDNTGLELNMTVIEPSPGLKEKVQSSYAAYVFIMDRPDIQLIKEHTVVVHVCCISSLSEV